MDNFPTAISRRFWPVFEQRSSSTAAPKWPSADMLQQKMEVEILARLWNFCVSHRVFRFVFLLSSFFYSDLGNQRNEKIRLHWKTVVQPVLSIWCLHHKTSDSIHRVPYFVCHDNVGWLALLGRCHWSNVRSNFALLNLIVPTFSYLFTPSNAPSKLERQAIHDLWPLYNGSYMPGRSVTQSREVQVCLVEEFVWSISV